MGAAACQSFSKDESKLDPTVAALIPKLVQSWGEGRFTSQGDMAKWIDGKFDNLEADLSGDMRGLKVEIQELLKNANKNMSQRMDQLVSECVENKITPVENQLTSMEMMLRRCRDDIFPSNALLHEFSDKTGPALKECTCTTNCSGRKPSCSAAGGGGPTLYRGRQVAMAGTAVITAVPTIGQPHCLEA